MSAELHIMVDIETLGTRPDAAILSIGAVVFAPHDGVLIRDRFYRGIDLASAMAGRAVDASTVRFWIVRPGNAFDAAFNGTDELAPSLAALGGWWPRPYDGARLPVWANGPAFDLVILEHAYRQHGMVPPWGFREHRDCRTLKALAVDAPVPERAGTEHHALADAEHQAACVAARLRWLRERAMPAAASASAGTGDAATGDM